ncbi:MAG: hypothetical protein WCA93_06160, partial [Acidimicrobiia bacterium]
MSVSGETEVKPQPPLDGGPGSEGGGGGLSLTLLRIGVSLVVPILAILGLYYAGTVLLDADANRALVVVMALIVGVLGVFGLYYGMDWVINHIPDQYRDRVRPFAFVGPAVVILGIFLLYPTFNT